MPADAYGYSDGMPRPQDVLNAVAIPARWTTGNIDVTVRLVWEKDGEEHIDGHAIRWTSSVVYVEFDDRRIRTTGVWVAAGDVVRR